MACYYSFSIPGVWALHMARTWINGLGLENTLYDVEIATALVLDHYSRRARRATEAIEARFGHSIARRGGCKLECVDTSMGECIFSIMNLLCNCDIEGEIIVLHPFIPFLRAMLWWSNASQAQKCIDVNTKRFRPN